MYRRYGEAHPPYIYTHLSSSTKMVTAFSGMIAPAKGERNWLVIGVSR
jgi:hypothetical protein